MRILSIDGGGVRGIIPARILQALEELAGKPIYQLFDLIVGTSTGGLIALALTCPDKNHGARYSAKEVLNIYLQSAPEIFPHSILRKLYTGYGLWGAKYSRKSYDAILQQLFGQTLLSQALCPVAIPTYSLINELPNLFCSISSAESSLEYLMQDIAGATSAAPTYFSPKVFHDNLKNKYIEVDGGIFANNPETIGIREAYILASTIKRDTIRLVSLGTGVPKLMQASHQLVDAGIIGWVMQANLIDIMLAANSHWSREEIATLYPMTKRLQVPLPKELSQMDNISKSNLQGLVDLAEDFVEQNTELLRSCLAATFFASTTN